MSTNKISRGTLGYINARSRQHAYDLVIREFKASGLTKAELARRMGTTPAMVSYLLRRPRNFELDTFSSLLFAISDGKLAYDIVYTVNPLAKRTLV